MNYDNFYQTRGGTPGRVESHSHFNDPIPNDGQPHGNSRRHGDAPASVQREVINGLLDECQKQGLSKEDAAHVLAIARIESGFNPDAAAGSTSASGLGQFIAKTGKSYGLDDTNRFDMHANAKALVAHYKDNKEMAHARGLGADFIYKLHHDGPSKDYGGLELAKKDVIPHAKAYSASELLASFKSNVQEAWHSVSETVHHAAVAVKQHVQHAYAEVKHHVSSALGVREPAHTAPTPHAPASVKELASAAAAQGLSDDAVRALLDHRYGDRPTEVAQELASRNIEKAPHLAAAKPAHNQPAHEQPTAAGPTRISLGQALAAHMKEKGFDEPSVSKAEEIAGQVKIAAAKPEAQSEMLVLHKGGAALASLASTEEAAKFSAKGDSALAMEKLEKVASHGLDTDAVATLRGLAPNETNKHSDLEVFHAAPDKAYAAAQKPDEPLPKGSGEQLLAGLGSIGGPEAPAKTAVREEKVAQAEHQAQMSMGA